MAGPVALALPHTPASGCSDVRGALCVSSPLLPQQTTPDSGPERHPGLFHRLEAEGQHQGPAAGREGPLPSSPLASQGGFLAIFDVPLMGPLPGALTHHRAPAF